MTEDSLHLDNQLCFLFTPALERLLVLSTLFRRNGYYVSPVHYFTRTMGARWTNSKRNWRTSILDSGTLTPMLKRMESLKLVKRVRSKEDERKVCIELTEQGKDLKEKACSLPTTMATNLGITEQEYRSLLIQLNKLIDTMKTINDGKGNKYG